MLLADRYVLGPQVTAGAMGAIHRAHTLDGRPVAAKRLLDERHAARFEIEGRLLQRLKHPRIVRVLDAVADDSGTYLIMEWIDGLDLAAVLARDGHPGVSCARVVDYALQACEALSYVHAQQTLHRDVKPQNLMLNPERGVVLVDFGIARPTIGTRAPTAGAGTPGFMAPEALVGAQLSPRSDVYGLGATVWALLTGSPPHLGRRERLPMADRAVQSTVLAALELDPQHRLPTADAFAAGLGGELPTGHGRDLGVSVADGEAQSQLLRAVVRATAGVFDAAASSLALLRSDGTLVYLAAWGAGADEIVGVELSAGQGIVGSVIAAQAGEVVQNCRSDPRFAMAVSKRTGYVPHTMIVVPLRQQETVIGALTILDRRDGEAYGVADLARAALFADLAVAALDANARALADLEATQVGSGVGRDGSL